MASLQDMPLHDGEVTMKKAMKVPDRDDPTYPSLSPQLANHLQIAPLIAIGILDKDARPWTTLWGGESGLARPLGGGIIGIRTPVPGRCDPVVEELVGKRATGEVVREEGRGRMVSGLTIDLEARKRVKMYGRMVAGALLSREDEVLGTEEAIAEIQLVLKIEQSLGNCPKYLNRKHIVPVVAKPEPVDSSPRLSPQALALLEKADLFFLSSSNHDQDMDTNHRGGPPGFLRVVSNDDSGAVIVWPEYSGNRLYQTLGNLTLNPLAGLCVPDFDTGDMLYFTGTTEILVGQAAAEVILRSNLAVRLTITGARFVKSILPFRGQAGERSPYNPEVRHLAVEAKTAAMPQLELQQAILLSQTKLTPTVSRFKFSLENLASYKPGQYVTLDFSSHLDMGYSHMRDDDPRSLNDDFVRTFTVSSAPGYPPNPSRRLEDKQFEITIRRVGVVTDFLFRHQGSESDDGGSGRGRLEVSVKGFGGEFEVKQEGDETICFIAAGVGITPLRPFLGVLEYHRLKLLWSVRPADLGFVTDMLDQHPVLSGSLAVFVSNAGDAERDDMEKLRRAGVSIHLRRLRRTDTELGNNVGKYYLCTAPQMRRQLMEWLSGKQIIFEDFNF